MPVNLNHLPVKSLKLGLKWLKWHNLFGKTINLDIITINNGDEIVERLFAREQNSLPSIPRVKLTITHQAIEKFV